MSGLNLPGVSYQFYTTLPTQWDALVHPGAQATWGQERQARAGSQLPQSAYAPLLMPYIHFGLGQTTDYVEDLTVRSESSAASSKVVASSKRQVARCETTWRRRGVTR